jgi:hypothetical protein
VPVVMARRVSAAVTNTTAPPTSNAVVIVHGMGEQKPLQMLKGFVRTALKPVGPR